MKHISFKQIFHKCLSVGLSMSMAFQALTLPLSANAAVLNLPNAPVDATSATVTAKPNFMFILDNSGSMVRDYISTSKSDDAPALRDGAQCKAAIKNRDGDKISEIKQDGNRLEIKTSAGTYTVGDYVYITVPELKISGQPYFSGVYVVKDSNYTSSTCTNTSSTATTQIRNPTTYGTTAGHSGYWTGVDAGRYWVNPVASCYPAATSPISNSGDTSNHTQWTTAGSTGGDPTKCGWYDPYDIVTPAGTCTSYSGASGGREIEVEVVPDGGGDRTFTASEIKDAYIQFSKDYNNNNPANGVIGWYEDSTCLGSNWNNNSVHGFEPPSATAQVNSLYYNPTITYEPPPQPNKVTSAYPANLMPSMTRSYTSEWTRVPKNGLQLMTAAIKTDPYYTWLPDRGTTDVGSPLTPAAHYWIGYNAVDITYKPEMVYCDTPRRPVDFAADKAWHESSRCKQNLATNNTIAKSPNYPYEFPAKTDGLGTAGLASNPAKTQFYYESEPHQYGVSSKSGKDRIAGVTPGGFYPFGEIYNQANPHYFNITPIEHCTTAQLTDCQLGAASGSYTFPSYVRYCKDPNDANNASINPVAGLCQAQYTGNYTNWGTNPISGDFRWARYGLFNRVEIEKNSAGNIDASKNYAKVASRTDCTGAVGPSGCTADQEMTNYANWFAYYRTRMLMMKSASARAFSGLDDNMRVGLMTINDPQEFNGTDANGNGSTGSYLKIDDFTGSSGGQKEQWLTTLYAVPDTIAPTPLRQALSTAGKVFAGKAADVGLVGDPLQFSCQKNISLLTTDGFWTGGLNDGTAQKVDGTPVVHQDSTEAPPKKDGLNIANTLADTAMYYAKGGLRNSTFSNCSNTSTPPLTTEDFCLAVAPDGKKMRTYTMGLGVDGTLGFDKNYYATVGTSADFNAIKAGTKNWPAPVPNGPAAVDDLWHAAVNGDGTYFSAKSPEDVTNSMQALFQALNAEVNAGTPAAVSSQRPSSDISSPDYGFSTSYIKGDWTGNIVARKLSTAIGSFYTTDAPLWCADAPSPELIAKGIPASCPTILPGMAPASRNIYISNGGGGSGLQAFTFGNLNATQENYFRSPHIDSLSQWATLTGTQQAAADEANLVNFIRGDKTYEETSATPDNRLYRERKGRLGDITESDPVHVGNPPFGYLDTGYSAFASAQTALNKQTVYVGANDGMLHAFDAANGNERWAFIPTAMLPKLYKLADKNYAANHVNFVNGKATVGDYYDGSQWRTILVSGYGEGARGLFALDITDHDAPKLLWENQNSKLGHIYGRPVITKKVNGDWVVLTTSGYNNIGGTIGGDGHGRFLALNPTTGAIVNEADIGTANIPGNLAPLSSLAVDPYTNNESKYAYAGDIHGNLWVFDIHASSVTKLAELKHGANEQPITVAPELVNINGDADTLVLVGTGKLLEYGDLGTSGVQTLYGIKDNHSGANVGTPRSSADFVQQVFTTSGQTRQMITTAAVDLSTQKGWWIDLNDLGERQISDSSLVAGVLLVPTVVSQGDTCSPTGHGWINYLDYLTGTPNPGPVAAEYVDATITGLVPLIKTDASGADKLDVTAFKKDTDVKTKGPIDHTGGASNRSRLIWHELIE